MVRLGHLLCAFTAMMILVLAQSCYSDQVLPPVDPMPMDSVSFAVDIIPIFNASCNVAGCHDTGGIPPDLTPANAYDALTFGGYINVTDPEMSSLYQWMRGNESLPMPLTGPNAEYNGIVLAWIKAGALNN